MNAIEQALAALTEMHNDYVEAAEKQGDKIALGNYCRGKRDAYGRAINVLRRAQTEETWWDRIKAVFR